MKALKLFIATAFMAMTTGAYAQFTNGKTSSASTVNTEGWSRISVSYLPSKLKIDTKGADDYNFQGFSVGWTKGFNVVKSLPLFVETGAALQFRTSSNSEDYDDGYYNYEISERLNVLSLNIPVNLIYKFNVNQDFSIEPMFGIDFRINMTGKYKITADDGTDSESEDFNIFNKGDMDDYLGVDPAKRFQAGWHIGANLTYKKITFGVNYGQDFNEIIEDCKLATTTVSLGYNF